MSLMKDKRVLYGVLAAAALVVGTVAYYKYSDSGKEVKVKEKKKEEKKEEEVDVGVVKRDAYGFIDFE